MYQSNERYRLYFKKLTNLGGNSISTGSLQVKSYSINRDLLTKATSKFEVLGIPSAVEIGDIVVMYDDFGTELYQGVVSYVNENTVEANQIYNIFGDNWLWNRPNVATIENSIKTIITNDYINSSDTLVASIFGAFDITTTSNTNLTLQSQESRYIVDFESFLYDIYEKYSVLLDFVIPFNAERPSINIGTCEAKKILVSNNTSIFRNFTISRNTYETNKLVVYGDENGEYRGTWYATTSGITDNPSALNRIQRTNTNIVFSDDPIATVKASNLRNQIFNHEITVEIVDKNNILSFTDLILGQEADIYFDDKYYNSILTGYSKKMSNNIPTGLTTLKFGLVRTELTSRLFKRLANGR